MKNRNRVKNNFKKVIISPSSHNKLLISVIKVEQTQDILSNPWFRLGVSKITD